MVTSVNAPARQRAAVGATRDIFKNFKKE